MDKILLIADDLTGALDAGVAFASAGIPTCVGQGDYFLRSEDAKPCSVQVTVVPSRHMSPEEAYRSVYDVVDGANSCGFTCIFKKTDSALRGNVGAELAAAAEALRIDTLHLIPAFPKMNRVTRAGVQYIDGTIPVAESVFGADPFNPVRHSAVAEIIRETSSIPTYTASPESSVQNGIAIYDAQTEEDILEIAKGIFAAEGTKLIAGCAGLAAVLPRVLKLEGSTGTAERPAGRLIVFCGSVNPISLEQCRVAAEAGAPRFHLIENGTIAEENILAEGMAAAAEMNEITVFDTGSADVDADTAVESGKMIASRVSKVIRGVCSRVQDATMFVIGGDTLIAFINSLGIETIIPVEELFPGVVLAKYHFQGGWHYLISKSGGFGDPDLLQKISLILSSPGATEKAGGD